MRCFCAAAALFLVAAPISAQERLNVRVLYCGDPGSAREADYRSFLERHFAKVTLRDLREFKPADANGQDVVIFDWTDGYGGKGDIDQKKWARLKPPHVDPSFGRPVILVGRAGGSVSMQMGLKINWLCLCLEGSAHRLALEHPLFHSPLEVDPKLEKIPTPEEFPELTLETLGPTMNVWKVQTKEYPRIDPGLVSGLYGFNDSPDAEVIAQGIAGKGPDTVSLGRQANFFLWGYSAPPSDMVPAAQRLFVNVVSYMRQFDGQTPLVRNQSRDRQWALREAASLRSLSEDQKQRNSRRLRGLLKEHPEFLPANHKGNADAFIMEMVNQQQAAERHWLEEELPEPLRKKFGMDADKFGAYYKENLEYLLIPDGRASGFVVDEDAKAVGPSNRRIELLERCVSKLERNEQPDVALRLLGRYTQVNFKTAAEWRTWLNANRSRLYFSDVGGYKFYIAPSKLPPRPATVGTRS